MAVDDLRQSPMMTHLLDALAEGKDIGHYGRLTFAMFGRHFMGRDELIALLAKDGDTDEAKAAALVEQVEARNYNPPRREKILAWQSEQDFPICPTPDDPDACNPYVELDFPDTIYQDIEDYREERYEAHEAESAAKA
ncbi:MAG: hypothetical protein M3462_08900 [Chloroflexota bacterium]|nr:hypothetical protein [Chloroflexota bacterium]